jgi:hypothetical protein
MKPGARVTSSRRPGIALSFRPRTDPQADRRTEHRTSVRPRLLPNVDRSSERAWTFPLLRLRLPGRPARLPPRFARSKINSLLGGGVPPTWLLKMPSILADLGIAWIAGVFAVRLGRSFGRKRGPDGRDPGDRRGSHLVQSRVLLLLGGLGRDGYDRSLVPLGSLPAAPHRPQDVASRCRRDGVVRTRCRPETPVGVRVPRCALRFVLEVSQETRPAGRSALRAPSRRRSGSGKLERLQVLLSRTGDPKGPYAATTGTCDS